MRVAAEAKSVANRTLIARRGMPTREIPRLLFNKWAREGIDKGPRSCSYCNADGPPMEGKNQESIEDDVEGHSEKSHECWNAVVFVGIKGTSVRISTKVIGT